MSLFRIFKYSSILFFLGKYKIRLFRVVAVLLFAGITSLLYQDVANYLQQHHPDAVIYALMGKIAIVYGALAFVLWQFRPVADAGNSLPASAPKARGSSSASEPESRLGQLESVSQHDTLRSRTDKLLKEKSHP